MKSKSPIADLQIFVLLKIFSDLSNIIIFNENNDLIYPLDFDETNDNSQMLIFELSKTKEEYGEYKRCSEGLYLYSIYNSDLYKLENCHGDK